MREEDARAFLEVHHAAVRGSAVRDYPSAVIEAWAPLPVTNDAITQIKKNREAEHRLIAEIDGQIVGIAAFVARNTEIRACYVAPEVSRKGVGSALLREIERAAIEQGLTSLKLDSSVTAEPFYGFHGYRILKRGEHVLKSGLRMACVKMHKDLVPHKI
jgi:putative acetyltransferase